MATANKINERIAAIIQKGQQLTDHEEVSTGSDFWDVHDTVVQVEPEITEALNLLEEAVATLDNCLLQFAHLMTASDAASRRALVTRAEQFTGQNDR